MNKQFFIAWIVVFVAWMAGSFVVHGMLLHAEYAKLPNLFRSEAGILVLLLGRLAAFMYRERAMR